MDHNPDDEGLYDGGPCEYEDDSFELTLDPYDGQSLSQRIGNLFKTLKDYYFTSINTKSFALSGKYGYYGEHFGVNTQEVRSNRTLERYDLKLRMLLFWVEKELKSPLRTNHKLKLVLTYYLKQAIRCGNFWFHRSILYLLTIVSGETNSTRDLLVQNLLDVLHQRLNHLVEFSSSHYAG